MSNNANATGNPEPLFFNLYLEGFATLYDAQWVKPKAGQSFEPFLLVRGAYLQGQVDMAEPLFIDLKVIGTVATKVIEHYMGSISDGAQKVSAVMKCGNIRIKSDGAGHTFVSAKLLFVRWLKVDGEVIDLAPFQEGSEEGRVANLAEHSQKPLRGVMTESLKELPERMVWALLMTVWVMAKFAVRAVTGFPAPSRARPGRPRRKEQKTSSGGLSGGGAHEQA